jgi:hypothetical protein
MRRLAVLAGAVLVAGLLGPATAAASDDDRKGKGHGDQYRWIAVEDQNVTVLPDGQTFDEENPPPEEEMEAPVGAQAFISEALYKARKGNQPGREIGRTHIECTAQAVTTVFLCDIVWMVDGAGQLHGTVAVDFTQFSETEPLEFDIAVTGGTGKFSGATGHVRLLDVTDPDDEEAPVTTLYRTDIEID